MSETATHELRSWPEQFAAHIAGRKSFDLRREDRGFAVGDRVRLREWDPEAESYTGRETERAISFITSADHPCAVSDAGLANGFCILGYLPTPSPQ